MKHSESVLVIGAGLSGLAAADALLDAGLRVTLIDAFPVVGGRVSSFELTSDVAGLVAGDVVEHGLHGWFQHYHALFALMARAGLPKPRFAADGVHFWNPEQGHFGIEGGQLVWLLNALRLPAALRGSRARALAAFLRLIAALERALANPEQTDRENARAWLERFSVPEAALRSIFEPCLFSLTSLRLHELSALEMLRWLSNILPDPRIRALDGGGTQAMCAPIARSLEARGAEILLGVEVRKLGLGADGRARLELAQAPDRTGLRHVLVSGFVPAQVPDPERFDAVVCTLPWERLLEVSRHDPSFFAHDAWQGMHKLRNVHPLSIRLWFEKPIAGPAGHYILSRGTVFDVLRPTPEPARYAGIRLLDALIDDMATQVPELPYAGERYLDSERGHQHLTERVLADLERLFPGQIRQNRLLRRFLHTREGIMAARPSTWLRRPPQYIGLPHFVLAGDFTRQPWGVCMEGAVRSGQLAARSLLAGRQVSEAPRAFAQLSYCWKNRRSGA
jgi:15-cis-phytoene desaturase